MRATLLACVVVACSESPPSTPPVDATPSSPDASATGGFADTGPAAVTEVDVSVPLPGGRDVDAHVCSPDDATARPLVIVSPGFAQELSQYASYCRHLASWGFPTVVAGYTGFPPSHSQAADDRGAILDWAVDAPALAAWDDTRVGLAGHSLGGKVSILAAVRDARVGVAIGWDPVDAGDPSVTPEQLGTLAVPLVVLGETLDGTAGLGGQACAPTADNYVAYYDAAASPAIELTLVGADHMDWVDDGDCFTCTFCQDGSADREVIRSLTRRTTVAALRRFLDNDPAADAWLTGDGVGDDIAAGRVILRAR